MRTVQIQSIQNEKIKYWKKLHTRKGREQTKSYLIEGERQLQEAKAANQTPRSIMVKEGLLDQMNHGWRDGWEEVPVFEISEDAYSLLVDTQTSQGIMAEVAQVDYNWDVYIKQPGPVTHLILDRIQDPGNLGSMLRIAYAMKVTAVWLGKGTVDPYNPKVVRAATGALFQVPIFHMELPQLFPLFQAQNISIVGTSPHAGLYPYQYPFSERTAVLLGNEGKGLQKGWDSTLATTLKIPMPGKAESYNVSVTAAILLYERIRQQSSK